MKYDGIDFNVKYGSSMSEADFITHHTDIAKTVWLRKTPEKVESDLKEAHQLLVKTAADDNSSGNATKIPESGSGGATGGSGGGKSATANGSKPGAAKGGEGQGESKAPAVQE